MVNNYIIKIKKEISKTKQTGDYNNLSTYAYTDDFCLRFIFMSILISESDLDLNPLYGDDITKYFVKYDNEGNVIKKMPYKYIKTIADKLLKRADFNNYNNIVDFTINNYFMTPEEFRNRMK